MAMRPVFEPLEARQHLAADLIATELTGKLPADLIAGERGRIPALGVNVNNAGNADVRQDIVVRLFASADGALDGTDFQLAETPSRLRLKAGRARHIPIKIRDVIRSDIPRGSYRLLAQVDATDVVVEDNPDNNVVASSGSVAIGPPFVNLTVSDLFIGNDNAVTQGRRARVALTVLNGGNITAKGNAGIQLTFTPVGGGAAAAPIDVPVRINQKSRKERALRGSFAVPATLAAGQYTVTATLISIVGFTDENPADNSTNLTGVVVRQR
jgi:hypothetical protein